MNKRSYVGDVRFNYFNNYGELELFYKFQKEENQRNIAKKYVSIFVNLKPFFFYVYMEVISDMIC